MADLSGFRASEAATATTTAKDVVKGNSPGAAWVFDDATGKWVKPTKPVSGNKTYTWDDAKGWVESGVDTAKLALNTGFVLTTALINDPVYGSGPRGLKAVYDMWAAGDETGAINAYFQSDYYLNLGKTAAGRFALSKNQPEVYAQELAAYIATQKRRLGNLGVNVAAKELDEILKGAYDRNFNDAQIDASIAEAGNFGATFGGSTLSTIESLRQFARSYGISYTDAKFKQWGADLFAGRTTDADIQKIIQTEAASAYPAYADQIMNGVSVDALASAYKSSMATILEIDADSIGYNDPTLRKALQYVGPDGKPSNKPLWQFESDLRSDARWQFTNNARDTIDSLQYKVMKDWGLM